MDQKITYVTIAAAVVFVAIWWKMAREQRKRGYALVTSMLPNRQTTYQKVSEMSAPGHYQEGWAQPDINSFASYISDGSGRASIQAHQKKSPSQRYDELMESSRLPSVASQLPQYAIDVASPSTYPMQMQLRVQLKNRLRDEYGGTYEMIRGSVPINYDPDECLIRESHHTSRDSQNFAGFFSQGFENKFNYYNGGASSQRNMPQTVFTQETLMD